MEPRRVGQGRDGKRNEFVVVRPIYFAAFALICYPVITMSMSIVSCSQVVRVPSEPI